MYRLFFAYRSYTATAHDCLHYLYKGSNETAKTAVTPRAYHYHNNYVAVRWLSETHYSEDDCSSLFHARSGVSTTDFWRTLHALVAQSYFTSRRGRDTTADILFIHARDPISKRISRYTDRRIITRKTRRHTERCTPEISHFSFLFSRERGGGNGNIIERVDFLARLLERSTP